MIFLTPMEVKQLTGKCFAATQCAVLRERGIKFILDGNGKPKVLRAEIERRLGSEQASAQTEPNFNVFKAA